MWILPAGNHELDAPHPLEPLQRARDSLILTVLESEEIVKVVELRKEVIVLHLHLI